MDDSASIKNHELTRIFSSPSPSFLQFLFIILEPVNAVSVPVWANHRACHEGHDGHGCSHNHDHDHDHSHHDHDHSHHDHSHHNHQPAPITRNTRSDESRPAFLAPASISDATPQYFVDKIFYDFGTWDGKSMSLENVTQLMKAMTTSVQSNSHSHDHAHRRMIKRDEIEKAICPTPEQLLSIHNIRGNQGLSRDQFRQITPSLLYLRLHDECAAAYTNKPAHSHTHAHGSSKPNDSMETYQIWLYASVSVAMITLAGLLGLVLLPLLTSNPVVADLSFGFLVALSVGTLIGDALMHLIPQVFGAHSHDDDAHSHDHHSHDHEHGHVHDHSFVWYGLAIIGGIYSFWMLEGILHHHHHHDHGHSHTHDHKHNEEIMSIEKNCSHDRDMNVVKQCSHNHDHHTHSHDEKPEIAPVGWLILFGGALHNIVDGLSIGVAYTKGYQVGISTTMAVLWHEIPHELSDYAVLLKAGFSKWRAAFNHVIANMTSFVGMAAGILLSTYAGDSRKHVENIVLAITAGNFLYIALADLIPELKSLDEDGSDDHSHGHGHSHMNVFDISKEDKKRTRWLKKILVHSGFFVGVGSMILIALYGEEMM